MNNLLINKVRGGAGDIAVAPKPAAYKDNLYLAVNGAWQEKAEIPADKSSAGASTTLDIDIEKNLMNDFETFTKNDSKVDSPEMLEAVKLYRLAKDTDKLTEYHEQPILKDIGILKELSSLDEWNQQAVSLAEYGFPLPIDIELDADMKDTANNVVYFDGPDLILPDQSYYDEKNESGKKLLAKYAEVAKKLLIMIGYTEDDAEETVTAALAFDKSLVPIVKTSEEWADYTKIYNPMKLADFVAKSKNVDLKKYVTEPIHATPEKIIVVQPRYLDNIDKLINEETFENLQAWMIVKHVMNNAGYLDEEFRQTVGQYNLAYSGAKELANRTKYAYHLAEGQFNEVVGVHYGKKYFGEKAKADVHQMVEQMIAIYKQRLTDNDWLSEDTKKKAIVKLDKIVIKVGYPDKVENVYKKYKVDESISLYSNIMEMKRVFIQDHLSQYGKPVDRSKWLMPGQLVNACYDPSRNDITFPAGILQAPFYSLKQTVSENFGGIGATFAHEISHAFDNNGAQFDEYGNMENWWTDEDYAKFKKLTQKMIDEFDGIPYAGGKVNGKLVVSENIADVGGLRCALEAAKLDENYNVKEFFITWAKSWQFKSTQQLAERYLATDVHAPEPLRANVHAQNLDEFYDAFDVRPGDGMWLDKDQRVAIW